MPAKPSGEVKTRTVFAKQRNGVTYAYERDFVYDPSIRKERQVGSRLVGKILPGTDRIVPTRPKRQAGSKAAGSTNAAVQADRQRVGMMEILEYVGKVSGIDALLYANTDKGTAEKIISIARYLVATDGGPLPSIVTFQYTHRLPYEDGLSESIYHDLFARLGRDAALEQSFFQGRCRRLGANPAIAYDSTTVSTYSEQQTEAQYVRGKTNDGLPKIKFLVLYEAASRQPIVFRKLKGNISDMTTVTYALKQLEVFGVRGAELITDSGYNSQENIANMLLAGYRFITPIDTDQTWVRKAIEEHMDLRDDPASLIPFDPQVHGLCVPLMHTFKRKRLYASSAKGLSKGALEGVRRRVYLQIYYNGHRKADEDTAFDERLLTIQQALQAGTSLEDLDAQLQSIAARFLIIRKRGSTTTVSCNLEAIAQEKKFHGFFALISNKRKDPADCLRQYRKRVYIELFFEAYKGKAGGRRPRVWSPDALLGRMFVQFVALCYREFFAAQIRTMIQELGVATGEHEHDLQRNLNAEIKLKNWLKNNSLRFILEWFDTVECTTVSTKLRQKRLKSELTARDRLFLTKLGVLK